MKRIKEFIKNLDEKYLWHLETKEEKLFLFSGILLLINMLIVLIFRNFYISLPLQIIATVLMVRSNNKILKNKYKDKL